MSAPRAIPEIEEEIQGINDLLYGRRGEPRVVDPAIRAGLGRRRRECKDEKIEAERLLGYHDFDPAPVDPETL